MSRPVHFRQQGRDVLYLAALGETMSTVDVERLIERARPFNRVILPPVDGSHGWISTALALAAAGAPVESYGLLPPPIGARTAAAIAAPPAISLRSRELRSIRIRRAALSEHHTSGEAAVSVLLSSRRPDDLPSAVAQVASQVGCNIQLVVGLHGGAFAPSTEASIADLWSGPLVIERFDDRMALGQILANLTERADGNLVSKWDDDDWYGQDHLADLASAHEYSGADVVGKAAEFVYLTSIDRTIRRFAVGAESYSTTLAGGTLLAAKDWIEHIGGWAPVRHDVDRRLLEATSAVGGTTYRTHGFQYVLRRRPAEGDHTWSIPDWYFLDAASDSRSGLRLDLADISGPWTAEGRPAQRSTTSVSNPAPTLID